MEKFIRFKPNDDNPNSFGSGFFSNYRIILEGLIINDNNMGGIPYIDWYETAWVEGFNPFNGDRLVKHENPFDFWFDQKIPTSNDSMNTPIDKNRHILIDHSKDYFYDKISLDKQREIENKYLKIKQPILDKIDEIYNNELSGHTVLGVIARGCEFNYHHPNYGVYSIHDYINSIKKILEENPQITKLFLVSEDSNYIKLLKESFPNSYFIPNVFRRTNETLEYMNRVFLWPNVDTKRENQNKLLGEETITQAKLLGKCDYLFGIHSGVFAGAVLWGENIKKIFKL
tara:strand:+ start:1181 stop:2038 length:858 start_codon:yes stop_codon:yes gene_type:complete